MQSKWKVASNPINGKTMYIVYRLKDVNAIDHSGNREYTGGYSIYKQAAQALADVLNKEMEEADENRSN